MTARPTPLSRRSEPLAPTLAMAAVLVAACATPVGVHFADARQVHRELTESALTGDRPSAPTQKFLTRMNLGDRFRRDPDALEGVDSELVVQPAGHSVQRHPEAIQELRRILLAHAHVALEGEGADAARDRAHWNPAARACAQRVRGP